MESVVLRDPAVDLDAPGLLLPEEAAHERPGHFDRVRLEQKPARDLSVDDKMCPPAVTERHGGVGLANRTILARRNPTHGKTRGANKAKHRSELKGAGVVRKTNGKAAR